MATPVAGLDDIRSIMQALQRMREMQATFDDTLDPIARAYQYLKEDMRVDVPATEDDEYDSLKRTNVELRKFGQQIHTRLQQVSPQFLNQLKNDVETLKHASEAFDRRYVEKGPLVRDIKAYDAAYRVEIFTQ